MCGMNPQARCVLARVLAMGSQFFDETVIRNDAGLFKAVYSFAYLYIYVTPRGDALKVVFSHYFLRDIFHRNSRVPIFLHQVIYIFKIMSSVQNLFPLEASDMTLLIIILVSNNDTTGDLGSSS